MVTILNFSHLKQSLISGYHQLANIRHYLNEINVFPLPDGDTGTNLYATLKSGVAHLVNQTSGMIHDLLQAFVKGLLMGARGNSGVIFSQIFRGFVKPIPASLDVLNNATLALCWQRAKVEAYEAVMKPVEGTMLSVMRSISTELKKMKDVNNISTTVFFQRLVAVGKKMVAKTQTLLAAVRKNNFVDAGALGFCAFLEGMAQYISTQTVVKKLPREAIKQYDVKKIVKPKLHFFGYCTELIIQLHDRYQVKFNLASVRKALVVQKVDSIVTGIDDKLLKIHGHTLRPGIMIDYLQEYGEFQEVKVENMTLQYHKLGHAEGADQQVVTYKHDEGLLLIVPNQQQKTFFKSEFQVQNIMVSQHLTMSQLQQQLHQLRTKNLSILTSSCHDQQVVTQFKKQNHLFDLQLLPTASVAEQFLALIYYLPGDSLKKNVGQMRRKLKVRKVLTIKQTSPEKKYLCYFNDQPQTKWEGMTNLTELATAAFKKYIILDRCEIVTIFHHPDLPLSSRRWATTFLQSEFDVEVKLVEAGVVDYLLMACIE